MKKLLCRVAILTLLVIQAKSLNLSSNTKLLSASLYKQIIKNDNKNICFSPLSAEIALAVLYVGARGETATEIRKVLQFPSSENHIEEAFKKFLKSIISTEDFSLHIANRIYFEAYLPVNIVFARVAKLAFEADMGNVDFSNTTRAAQTINQWVEAQTQNKIQNLVNPNNLKSNTVALLINALYLKAKWEHEFDKRETSKVKFYKGNDETVEVDGMSFFINDKSFKYAENDAIDAKILELSFKNQSAGNSMVIILPNNKTGLEKIEKNLDVALTIQLKEDIVEVMLPKFKVETQLDLKCILQNVSTKLFFLLLKLGLKLLI